MKALISIFVALLLVLVSNYTQAQSLGITRPKATNGAKDVQADDETKKEKIRITVEDFKDLSEKTMDDRVVEFRRGNEYYTMIPLRDLWFTPKRKEAFEVAQTFGDKLMKVWLQKTLNMRYGGAEEEIQREISKLSAQQILELLKKGEQNSNFPTAREIVEASNDASDAVKKLKERSKFFVEFDELITGFDKNQEELFGDRGLSSLKSKVVPTAFSFIASFKVPTHFLESLKNTKYLAGAGVLLRGSINFSVTTRPWYVVKRNLDTGEQTSSWYIESASQAWLLKDLKTDKAAVTGPLRLGVGVLWGDYDRMADIHGFVTGYSKSFNFKKTSLDGALAIPSYTNVKVGTISAAAETLTKALDITNFVKNGYFMMTRQFGFQAPMGATGNWDVGGVFNLASITDRVALNQDTLEDLLKTVAEEVPGAEVIIRDDQIEILIPEEKSKNPKSSETAPTQDDLEPLKGQEIVPSVR